MKKKRLRKHHHQSSKKKSEKINNLSEKIDILVDASADSIIINNINNKENQGKFNICPICNKEIKDVLTSITEKSTKKLAHFDCIVECLKKAEELKKNEGICYIGSGFFAVVEYKNTLKTDFSIVRKIKYEEKDIIALPN